MAQQVRVGMVGMSWWAESYRAQEVIDAAPESHRTGAWVSVV